MAVEQNATEDANRLPPRGALAPKSGSQKLKVGIVGAGIGGLMAAVALLEGGHDVEVSSREPSMPLSGNHWGILWIADFLRVPDV